jgi:hypothetical protein
MANCNNLFIKYNDELQINKSKKNRLRDAKDILRKRITKYFADNHPEYVPCFFIQGSYKMRTMIKTKDDECDLDDGVYFLREPDVSATTVQKWVYQAVEGHTQGGQEHRKKCIRVIYGGDYHIDLPVYYKTAKDEHPHLAVKNEGWELSDPKEFLEWFKDVKNEQMVRVSRYLKGWGDHKRNNMPSGLIMMVLTEKCLQADDREDIAIYETLKSIDTTLSAYWSCRMPTTPKDDLLSKYDDTFKRNFFSTLRNFIADAKDALEADCQEKASKLWQKHLGIRFPLGEKEEKSEAKSIADAEKEGSLLIGVANGTGSKSRLMAKSKGGVYGSQNF